MPAPIYVNGVRWNGLFPLPRTLAPKWKRRRRRFEVCRTRDGLGVDTLGDVAVEVRRSPLVRGVRLFTHTDPFVLFLAQAWQSAFGDRRARAGPALLVRLGVEPLFARWINVRRDLHAACRRAGIPAVTPNDLRRTFGTWLRAEGVEPHLIGAAMGHSDSRMVERVYGRIDATDLRRQLVARVGDPRLDSAQRHGDEARQTGTSETTVVVIPREILCPGAESNRRHADFQSRRTNRGAAKIVRIGALTRPDGTKLHTPSVRTFGELLDVALGLGGGR